LGYHTLKLRLADIRPRARLESLESLDEIYALTLFENASPAVYIWPCPWNLPSDTLVGLLMAFGPMIFEPSW
jgi:hypothetical protein